jgi:hypothetical protein
MIFLLKVALKYTYVEPTPTSLKNITLENGDVISDVEVLLWCIGRSANIEGLSLLSVNVKIS